MTCRLNNNLNNTSSCPYSNITVKCLNSNNLNNINNMQLTNIINNLNKPTKVAYCKFEKESPGCKNNTPEHRTKFSHKFKKAVCNNWDKRCIHVNNIKHNIIFWHKGEKLI
jgi:hypothetical protein